MFYPLSDLDINREFYIKVDNTTIPANATNVRAFISKSQSPYDSNPNGNVVQLIGEITSSGGVLERTFVLSDNAKTLGNYIAVCQYTADENLCQFNVTLGYNDCIERKVDKGEIIEKDVILYNDTVFANGRTLKIYNPYKEGGSTQYAGQMHCHSWDYQDYEGVTYKVPLGYTVQQIADMTTDAERAVAVESVNQQFVQAHKDVGYSFMTITNYDNFNDYTKQPMVMPNDSFIWLGNAYETSTGGWDNTGQAEDQGAHLNIINTNFAQKFRNWTPKEIVDYCENKNCIVTYNHPFLNMLYSSPSWVKNIKSRLRFIEVFNGLGVYHADYNGVPYIKPNIMLDEDFDALISQGNFTFATAVSDQRTLNTETSALRQGCVRVFANNLTHKDIINALLSGNFYAASYLSDSVKINGVSIDNGQYIVNVGLEDVIVEFLGKDNTILSTVTTSSVNTIAAYDITGAEDFIRARLYKLNSETYDASAWHKNKEWIIWTQPIFIAKELL